jgi:4'-phosphopantetheinyl transferase
MGTYRCGPIATVGSLWRRRPETLTLGEGSVHVFAAALTDPHAHASLVRLLSPDERERAARFQFELHRRRFVVARGLLRSILGSYLGVRPDGLRFAYGPRGKPRLEMPPSTLRFSVAHSQDLALLAFSHDRELGVDVEAIRHIQDAEGIARRFFSASESVALAALPAFLKMQGFFNGWTRKEAFIKATGEGLAFPLDQFDVALAPGQPARLLRLGWSDGANGWTLRDLEPAPGYAAALAFRGQDVQIECWRWV